MGQLPIRSARHVTTPARTGQRRCILSCLELVGYLLFQGIFVLGMILYTSCWWPKLVRFQHKLDWFKSLVSDGEGDLL